MAKWFPLAVGSIFHGRGFANNSLLLLGPGSTPGTRKRWSVSRLAYRWNAYIRGRDLDTPDVTLNNLLVIAPGF
jgi:hypothetical protein